MSARWLVAFFALSLAGIVTADASFSPLGRDATAVSGREDAKLRRVAPDYGDLRPFYVGQATASSCSAASIAMLVNAALTRTGARPREPVDEHTLLAAVGESRWEHATAPGGDGVSFRQLTAYLRETLAAFGFPEAELQTFIPTDRSPATRWQLREFFATLDRGDFILAAFDQGALTGGEHVGHVSPIGAFDRLHDRVLVLDVDRESYPAYWSKADTFLEALLHRDPADPGDPNGLIRVHLPQAATETATTAPAAKGTAD
jgi:hypothetical protein